jgi:RNA polymerase sigma factor (sigma-70 family)
MVGENQFRDLMRRVREGSPEAICELVRKYERHVRRAVRRVLDPKLRSKFDSMDFVQLAWKSFFRLPKHAARLDTSRDFIAYVVKMACNKALMENRHGKTKKHSVRREIPLGEDCEDAVAPGPQPVDTAIALEHLEQLLKSLSPLHRKIIELRLQENTFVEIGKKLNIDLHTAHRFIRKLEKDIRW